MIYEITLKGFDITTDTTDEFVKWVQVADYGVLSRFVAATGLIGHLQELPRPIHRCDHDEADLAVGRGPITAHHREIVEEWKRSLA